MKFVHLSDLHLGKRVNEFSMLEDQDYILTKIIEITDAEQPDGVLIAGDVYDKAVPPTEAVKLFDDFLVKLSKRGLKVFIISGNHDSPERLSFASRLIELSGIYLSPAYGGEIKPVVLNDGYGEVAIYMLPFVKPAHVARFFPDEGISSYTDAIKTALAHTDIDENRRNILLTHQFVTGAERSESEEVSVGGTDNVDASVFEKFDYVALGHIHKPQNVSKQTVRYCGTPLKYSFSEVRHEKSVTIVELNSKGSLNIRTVPLFPKRDMVELRGTYAQVMDKTFREKLKSENYYRIILTDEEDIPDCLSKLRTVYPNLMVLEYDNKRTRNSLGSLDSGDVQSENPLALFSEFYEKQNGQPMTDEMNELVCGLIEKIWGDGQ